MKYQSSQRFWPRDSLARFFVACTLVWGALAARAQEFDPPITNASPLELQSVENTLDRLEKAAVARDANALAFFGASVPADDATLRITDRITHVAVAEGGALVRQVFTVSIQRKPTVVLTSGARKAPPEKHEASRIFSQLGWRERGTSAREICQ